MLNEAERERKIHDFLDRKLKEFDLDDDEPLPRSASLFPNTGLGM